MLPAVTKLKENGEAQQCVLDYDLLSDGRRHKLNTSIISMDYRY
jgi:hypothetical protein